MTILAFHRWDGNNWLAELLRTCASLAASVLGDANSLGESDDNALSVR